MGLVLDGPKENEEIVQLDGVGILINTDAKPYTSDKIIDYVTAPEGEGFTIQDNSGSCC